MSFFDADNEKPYKKKKERDMEVLRKMMENKARFDAENSSDNDSIIDWDNIDDAGAAGQSSLWEDFPPVEKHFYKEADDVKNMRQDQVDQWRLDNHNMKVDYVPKNADSAEEVVIQQKEGNKKIGKHYSW